MSHHIVHITSIANEAREETRIFPDLSAAIFFLKAAGFHQHKRKQFETVWYQPETGDKAEISTTSQFLLANPTILESWR